MINTNVTATRTAAHRAAAGKSTADGNAVIAAYNAAAPWDRAVSNAPARLRGECLHCGHGVNDDMIPCHTRTAKAVRYIHTECWDALSDTDAAHRVIVGKRNGTGFWYRYTLEVRGVVRGALHADLIGARENPYMRTGDHQYVSPTHNDNRGGWTRIESLIKETSSGILTVEVSPYGTLIPEYVRQFTWGNRDERGKFIRKSSTDQGEVLDWIAACTGASWRR